MAECIALAKQQEGEGHGDAGRGGSDHLTGGYGSKENTHIAQSNVHTKQQTESSWPPKDQ